MTCLMWNVYKYIYCFFIPRITLLALNGYETGLSTGKKCNSHVLREGARRGPCQHRRKKSNKHCITAKKSRGNTDIAL